MGQGVDTNYLASEPYFWSPDSGRHVRLTAYPPTDRCLLTPWPACPFSDVWGCQHELQTADWPSRFMGQACASLASRTYYCAFPTRSICAASEAHCQGLILSDEQHGVLFQQEHTIRSYDRMLYNGPHSPSLQAQDFARGGCIDVHT